MRKHRTSVAEYSTRVGNVTRRITLFDDDLVEIHSTLIGYPIRFKLDDELREFLRSL